MTAIKGGTSVRVAVQRLREIKEFTIVELPEFPPGGLEGLASVLPADTEWQTMIDKTSFGGIVELSPDIDRSDAQRLFEPWDDATHEIGISHD